MPLLPRTFAFRLTEAEASVILAAAAELKVTPSTYLRSLFCAHAKTGPRIVHPICSAQWVELSRVASNLNQVAHALNRGDEVAYADLQDAIRDTLSELRAVRNHLAGGGR